MRVSRALGMRSILDMLAWQLQAGQGERGVTRMQTEGGHESPSGELNTCTYFTYTKQPSMSVAQPRQKVWRQG